MIFADFRFNHILMPFFNYFCVRINENLFSLLQLITQSEGIIMQSGFVYAEQHRLIAKVLNMYYLENLSQVDISRELGLSTAKVNRLIKNARQEGMIEINLRLPFPSLLELESRLITLSNLEDVIVTPSLGNTTDADLLQLAQVVASYFADKIRTNDSICIGGGRTVSEIINHVERHKIPGVRVIPALGGIQNRKDREVNSIATRLADILGGEAINFYAPAFAETEEECETFFSLTHIVQVLNQARSARIGLFGIGSLQIDSSIIQYCSLPYNVLDDLVKQRNGVGEILIYAIDRYGKDCIPEISKRVIGISMEDFRNIPIRIGAASGLAKAPAIAASIRGNLFTTLAVDEITAKEVVRILELDPPEEIRNTQ